MYEHKKQITIRTYDLTARAMARKFNDIGPRRNDIERTLARVGTSPSVVELGCGNGRDAAVILEFTDAYLGMDASSEMIAIAARQLPKAKFAVADFESFNFPANTDVIFAFASLIHADKRVFKDILRKAYGSLRNDGVFFMSLKHGAHAEISKEDEFGMRTYYLYSEEDIRELIGNDYKIIDSQLPCLREQEWLDITLQKLHP